MKITGYEFVAETADKCKNQRHQDDVVDPLGTLLRHDHTKYQRDQYQLNIDTQCDPPSKRIISRKNLRFALKLYCRKTAVHALWLRRRSGPLMPDHPAVF